MAQYHGEPLLPSALAAHGLTSILLVVCLRIGSFPIIVDEIAALHTRPSVVSLQFAGFDILHLQAIFLDFFCQFLVFD